MASVALHPTPSVSRSPRINFTRRKKPNYADILPSYDPKFTALVDTINAELAESPSHHHYLSNISHFVISPHDHPSSSTSLAPALSASGKPLRAGLVLTSQPQSGDISEMVDGRTECIFNSISDKNAVLSVPGYPQRVPRPSQELGYVIEEVEGKGLGMVATRNFSYGEMIASERPLIIAPTRLTNIGFVVPEEDCEGNWLQLAGLTELERTLKVAIGRMSDERRNQYLGLYDCQQGSVYGPLTGIMSSNSFPLPLDEAGGSDCQYGAVFKDLSRINHSCSPNTIQSWDRASLSLQFYAARPISEGEEITTSYCDLLSSYSERKHALAQYGVSCTCAACANPIPSTANRMKLRSVHDGVADIIKWCSNPSLPDHLLLDPALELLGVIEMEGLESHPCYAKVVHQLACIYAALGDDQECGKFVDKRRVWDWMNAKPRGEEEDQASRDVEAVRAVRKAVGRGKGRELRSAVVDLAPVRLR